MSSNSKWMLFIVKCLTVLLVKLHLFWSSARSFIALLNMIDEMKIEAVENSKCFYCRILTTS